jgi:hypothetical protein
MANSEKPQGHRINRTREEDKDLLKEMNGGSPKEGSPRAKMVIRLSEFTPVAFLMS